MNRSQKLQAGPTEEQIAEVEAAAVVAPSPTTPEPTKAEKLAAERAVIRAAKALAKALRKERNRQKRANGVIGTLHQNLLLPQGVTKREILAILTDKFPDRDPIGMATTVGIQLSRLQKKFGKIVSRKQGTRGLVYGYSDTVQYEPEGSNGVVPVAPLTEPIDVPPAPVESIKPEGWDRVEAGLEQEAAAITDIPVPEPEPIKTTPKQGKKNKKH